LNTIPDDFPRDPFPALLSGSQIKIAGRFIEGKLVVGLTADERAARYAMCLDLVTQLVAYCDRKHQVYPGWEVKTLLAWVGRGVNAKQHEWGIGDAEVDWIMQEVTTIYAHKP